VIGRSKPEMNARNRCRFQLLDAREVRMGCLSDFGASNGTSGRKKRQRDDKLIRRHPVLSHLSETPIHPIRRPVSNLFLQRVNVVRIFRSSRCQPIGQIARRTRLPAGPFGISTYQPSRWRQKRHRQTPCGHGLTEIRRSSDSLRALTQNNPARTA